MGQREKARRRARGTAPRTPGYPGGATQWLIDHDPGHGGHLAKHVPYCRCTGCERRREVQLAQQIEDQRPRLKDYWAGHPNPEHLAGWAATCHALSAFMALHDVSYDRRAHVTTLELRPEFVEHIEGLASAHELGRDLDVRYLHDAYVMLRADHPLRFAIVQGCVLERRTQSEVGAALGLSQRGVGKHLEGARDDLLRLYGCAKLLEEHAAHALA